MSEMRLNKITRRWTIYAADRAERPFDFAAHAGDAAALPRCDPLCPFCPGNEHLLPPIIATLPENGEPWQTRVVPNKFPILTPHGMAQHVDQEVYMSAPGYGHHEVIIETPRHDADLFSLSKTEAAAVIDTYHRRYTDLAQDSRNLFILLFRNHGPGAGTSLVHPHSQLITTGVVPPHVRMKEHQAERYFDEWGRCGYCDILKFESRERMRVVFENETFLAFVPYAAEVPFEIWAVPKRHSASFLSISDAEKEGMVETLQYVLGRLHERAQDPDYNYIVHSAARQRANEPYLHWYVQIKPRVSTMGGFEIATDIAVNPSLPENDARRLLDEEFH